MRLALTLVVLAVLPALFAAAYAIRVFEQLGALFGG